MLTPQKFNDRISIQQLKVPVVIGVFPFERGIKQDILVDITVEADISQAAKTDDLTYTIDYAALTKFLIDFIGASEYQLLETLAEKTAAAVLANFKISSVKLVMTKKPQDMPEVASVSVSIARP